MSTSDALTVRQSKAELWVAYHRKILLALAPVLLAGFVVIQDTATAGEPIRAVTIVTAILAVGQALGTYLPGNALAKLISSGVFAIASGVTAAATDGLNLATGLMVATQLLAWIGSGVAENGARPDVVLGSVVGAGVHDRLRPLPE
jgi:mannose/fructose/N-acetylgalactosamine-specific phosphotransferase system component IIC